RRAPQGANEPAGVHGRPVAEEDTAPEDRRDARLGPRLGLLRAADLARRGELLLDGGVLARRRGDLQHPALAEPGVLAPRLEERPDPRDDPVARAAELERGGVAEERAQRRQVRPVAVAEAAVPAARPEAAEPGLEDGHAQLWIALAEREGGPEARVAAPDDRHVHLERAGERRRAVAVVRIAEPPARLVARADGRPDHLPAPGLAEREQQRRD